MKLDLLLRVGEAVRDTLREGECVLSLDRVLVLLRVGGGDAVEDGVASAVPVFEGVGLGVRDTGSGVYVLLALRSGVPTGVVVRAAVTVCDALLGGLALLEVVTTGVPGGVPEGDAEGDSEPLADPPTVKDADGVSVFEGVMEGEFDVEAVLDAVSLVVDDGDGVWDAEREGESVLSEVPVPLCVLCGVFGGVTDEVTVAATVEVALGEPVMADVTETDGLKLIDPEADAV